MSEINNDVSVIIPTYDQNPEYLECALMSVAMQTLKPKEVIVVNDGGNTVLHNVLVDVEIDCMHTVDDDVDIYSDQLFGIPCKLIEYRKNLGTAHALNVGLKYSTGQTISWLSSDDFFYPQFLEIHMLLRKHLESTQVTYSGFAEIDINQEGETTRIMDHRPPYLFDGNNSSMPRLVKQSEFFHMIKSGLVGGSCRFNGCAFVIDRAVYDKVGGFNADFTFAQDLDMWIRVSKNSDVIMVPQILMCRRNHMHRTQHLYSNEEFYEKRKWEFNNMRERYLNG